MAELPGGLTTGEAAELAGRSVKAFLTMAGRARRAGVELHAPRDTWPDGRTPRWSREALAAYLPTRPGRGANLRGPAWRDAPGEAS